MTFYLKYRPQTIFELDLDSIRQQLSQILQTSTIPHAFLFAGPRGLGKTSTARILAKAINCEIRNKKLKTKRSSNAKQKSQEFSKIEPCNKCPACTSITKGTSLDFIEIDGASNRGIDDIRELRERVKLSPSNLTKKVYVIDEVHMLTKEAFNALLKTLEEPPDHVVFILATTELEKLPATIVSRCFTLLFKHPNNQEMERALSRVIKKEKLKVDSKTLELIIAQADGSFRDGVKTLEQLAFANKKIDSQLFKSVFQASSQVKFLELLQKKETTPALDWIDQAKEKGMDWKSFLINLLSNLRDKLLAKFGLREAEEPVFSEEELRLLITLFSRAAGELKSAPIPHLPLELAVIEYCGDEKPSGEIDNSKLKEKVIQEKDDKKEDSNPGFKVQDIEASWEEVLKIVKPQNHSIEALLRSTKPKGIRGKAVLIEVFYEFHKGRLETEKCRNIVEAALRQVFNNEQLKVDYILREKTKESVKQDAKENPDNELVQMAEEVFGA